jgi:hypothetical protein
MDIKNTSDLAKIADLCRKKGIESIKITQDSVEFKMADKPVVQRRGQKGTDKIDSPAQYSEEDVINWSVQG